MLKWITCFFVNLFMFFNLSTANAAMKDMLIYYGWLNAFNSATNSWDNDLVAADMGSNYDILVFGDGIADPSHPDFSNSQYIISKIKADYPTTLIFGYVSANQALQDFQTKASQWDTMVVDGIFMDEMGYDFSVTRQQQNYEIMFVKQLNYATMVFANSWNVNHVLGILDDPSYPNATYNPNLDQSLMDVNDWYLLESFVWNQQASPSPAYFPLDQELDRLDKARLIKQSIPVNLASVAIIDDLDPMGQMHFDRLFKFSHIGKLDAVGSSDLFYGAGTAKTYFWSRPSVTHL